MVVTENILTWLSTETKSEMRARLKTYTILEPTSTKSTPTLNW
jgi:hypothetical protein